MKTNKFPYVCLVYEIGDIVADKFGVDLTLHTIVQTRFDVVGKHDVQFLKFSDSADDLNISSHFAPAGSSIDKYANGVPTKSIMKTTIKVGVRKDSNTKVVKKSSKNDIDIDMSQFTRILSKGSMNPQ